MRRPVQCDGIERGPERAVQIGVIGTVQPQLFGLDLGGIASGAWDWIRPKIPGLVNQLVS